MQVVNLHTQPLKSRSRPATCSAPAGRVSSLLKRSGATAAGHTSHRLLRVPPIRLLPLPESHLQVMMPRAQCEPRRHTGWQPVCLSVSRCTQGCPCPVAGRSLRASCQSCSARQMQDGSTRIWPGSVLPRSTGCQPVCLSVSRCAQGCPCPVAGRSLRASCPPLTRCRLRSRHPAFACRQRRLSEHGQPLACPHRSRDWASCPRVCFD